MAEKPDSDPFLVGLDAKIAALQTLRESYVAALSVGALGLGAIDVTALPPPTGGPGASGTFGSQQSGAPSGPIELPTGVFRTKGLADAIRLYLDIAKRKQTTKEISIALLEGGLASTASDFEQTLKATLYRLRDGGELLQFKDGWDLAASYPESFRQRMAQNADAAPRTRKRKRSAKKANKTPQAKATRSATEKASAPKKVEKAENKPEANPVLRAV